MKKEKEKEEKEEDKEEEKEVVVVWIYTPAFTQSLIAISSPSSPCNRTRLR